MKKLSKTNKFATMALATSVLLAMAQSSRADGFLSALNPFVAKTTTAKAPASTGTASSAVITPSSHSNSIITAPQLGGKPVRPPVVQPSQPSLLSRMGNGTANFFSKTKQMFSPSKSAAPTKITGGPGTTTTTPKTVTQFIGQPRP